MTNLGEYGKKQAAALATKMSIVKIDHLYSSEWPRAFQTAEFISNKMDREIKIHPLVHEIMRNPILDDTDDVSEINKQYHEEIKDNQENFDWKFGGLGESLNEVIKRAQMVIDFLVEKHPDETVAIVSHGIFITLMTILILLGKDWDRKTFQKLLWSLKLDNTGVCTFEFDPKTSYWTMSGFNDHSHLGG